MPNPIPILVVEDEPLIRVDLSDFLADAGFDVVEAGDAEEALSYMEQRAGIRVVITDVDMPGNMDGLGLARAVADRWPPVKIVVVSGHRMVEITDIPDGSVFFSKPFHQPQLLASVRELLN